MTNETYEIALSEDGENYTDFIPFTPGDVRLLDNFVKFRVTVSGDFSEDEYRLRGFAGIVDDATTSVGGFGITPFGRFPFADGGICLEDTGGALSGELQLSGTLEALAINQDFLGSLSLSGALAVHTTGAESGSLALSGTLASVLTQPALAVLGGSGPTLILSGAGTFYVALATEITQTVNTVENNVAIKVPVGLRITSISVVLGAAMAINSTHTYRIMVNGVASNGIVLVLTTGQQSGTALGDVLVNAGDTISLEIAGTGGGVGAVVQAVTCGYEVL